MALGDVVAAFAQAGAELRQKLERWQTSLPRQLAERDEATIRATLIDQTERILLDIEAHFRRFRQSLPEPPHHALTPCSTPAVCPARARRDRAASG